MGNINTKYLCTGLNSDKIMIQIIKQNKNGKVLLKSISEFLKRNIDKVMNINNISAPKKIM